MYVAAGIWGRRPLAFAAWSFLAVVMWTPLLVVFAFSLGSAVVAPLIQGIEVGVVRSLLTGAVLFGMLKLTGRVAAMTARYHQRFAHTIETPI